MNQLQVRSSAPHTACTRIAPLSLRQSQPTNACKEGERMQSTLFSKDHGSVRTIDTPYILAYDSKVNKHLRLRLRLHLRLHLHLQLHLQLSTASGTSISQQRTWAAAAAAHAGNNARAPHLDLHDCIECEVEGEDAVVGTEDCSPCAALSVCLNKHTAAPPVGGHLHIPRSTHSFNPDILQGWSKKA